MTDTTTPPAVPMRPLGVAELLDSAVRCVRFNARASFSIAFPIAVIRSALVAALTFGAYDDTSFAVAELLLEVLIGGLLGTILAGLLTPVFTGELFGRRVGAADAMRAVGTRAAFGLAGLAVVVAVAQEVGVVVLFVGGAWLWGLWAVAAPVLVAERTGIRAALRRSTDLVRTQFWRTWGIRSLRWVVTTVLGIFLTLPFTGLASLLSDSNPFAQDGSGIHDPAIYVTVAAIGSLVAHTILGPVSAAVDVLLYTDLRMRKEGMDLVVSLPEVPPASPAAPAVSAW